MCSIYVCLITRIPPIHSKKDKKMLIITTQYFDKMFKMIMIFLGYWGTFGGGAFSSARPPSTSKGPPARDSHPQNYNNFTTSAHLLFKQAFLLVGISVVKAKCMDVYRLNCILDII